MTPCKLRAYPVWRTLSETYLAGEPRPCRIGLAKPLVCNTVPAERNAGPRIGDIYEKERRMLS